MKHLTFEYVQVCTSFVSRDARARAFLSSWLEWRGDNWRGVDSFHKNALSSKSQTRSPTHDPACQCPLQCLSPLASESTRRRWHLPLDEQRHRSECRRSRRELIDSAGLTCA